MSLDRLFGANAPRPATGRLDSLFGPVRTNQQYDQGLEAPTPAAPKPDYGFFGNIGDTVSNFTSGLQKNFNESGVGQAAAAVESKIREPGEWLSDRLGIAKPGTPGSSEYEAAKLLHFRDPNYVPTPEEVQAQGTYQNSILNFGLGGGLKSVGSVGRVGATGSLSAAREPLALSAPRTPELAAPVRPAYREGLTRGGPFDAAVGQGNYNTNLPPIEQPWGRIPQPASRYVPTGSPAEAPLEGVFRELPDSTDAAFRANRGPGVSPEAAARIKSMFDRTRAEDAARAPSMPLADLKARIGVREPAPLSFKQRVGGLTPIGREDLTLGRGVAKGTEPVPPVSIDELRSRIGAKTTASDNWQEGVPLNAEQLSARIGAKNRPQTENALRMGQEVEARQAKAGTLGASGISGPLVGRAVGRGSSQLARSGIKAPGLEATPGDLNASLVRQTKVHYANEAAIAAAKSGDTAALARAKADVQLLGGDLKHTDARIRRAGVTPTQSSEVGRRTTTDATVMSDMQASIDALKARSPLAGLAELNAARKSMPKPTVDRSRGTGENSPFNTKAGAQAPASSLEGKNVPSSTGSTTSVPDRGLGRNFLKEEGGSTTVEKTPIFGGAIKKGVDLLGTSPGGRSTIGTAPKPMSGLRRAEQIIGATKTITTAASPAHFMFRHALPFMASHPNAWFKGGMKGLGEGLKMTPSELDVRIGTMQKNLDANGMGNLYLGKPHLGVIGGEENVASNFAGRFGPLGDVIRRGGQGFVQGLNEVRYEAAKGALNTSVALEKRGFVKKITADDRRAIADRINNYSGRGIDTRANPMTADALRAQRLGKPLTADELKGINNLHAKQTIVRAANLPMFSPQLTAARVRMLTEGVGAFKTLAADIARGRPVKAQDLETARLSSGAVIGIGALYLLASAAGGKPDLANPVAGTFGNVDIGAPGPGQAAAAFAATEIGMGTQAFPGQNVSVNPTESESTLIRNIARMAVALYDTATNQKNLMRMEGAKQETSPMDVATRSVLSQIFTSPIAYPIAQWLQGYSVSPTDAITPMPLGSLLRGAGIQPPTVGGKPPATPKPAPAPKVKK